MKKKMWDFVNKHIKEKVDFDGKYGCQCVDLFRQYCVEVLEIKGHTGSVNGAKELFTKFDILQGEVKERDFFIRHPFPLHYEVFAGDVAIWDSSSTNIYGHVAIILQDMGTEVLVFEQDGFKQDGAKIKIRSKDNLLGVLRRYWG
ncbi:MAG: CHAP domain-containing protein [Treponema sp.]|nr:CHAP domain-containing protein [Treponema sp.]